MEITQNPSAFEFIAFIAFQDSRFVPLYRDAEGWSPLPGGNSFFVPLKWVLLRGYVQVGSHSVMTHF